jgi:hypothetical protein
MRLFNNREIASGFWLLAFAAFALRRREVRESIANLVRISCHLKIVVPVGLMLLHTTGVVVLLRTVGLWKVILLKDTVVWFALGAMVMMMRLGSSDDAEEILRKVVADNIKVVILLEFLSNTSTFSLPVELVLVPVLASVAVIDVVASHDQASLTMAKVTKRLQAMIGLVLLCIVLARAIADFQNLRSWDTARSIVLAPLLSIFLTPFLYAMALYSRYELVFLRLNLGIEKEPELKRYARRRIMKHSRLSLKRLQRLLRYHAADLMQIRSKAGVEYLLRPNRESDHSSRPTGPMV